MTFRLRDPVVQRFVSPKGGLPHTSIVAPVWPIDRMLPDGIYLIYVMTWYGFPELDLYLTDPTNQRITTRYSI